MNRSSGLGVFFKVSKGLAVFLESWLPAAGGEGVEEVAEPSLLDHAEFARPEGLRGRHVLGGAGLGEARDVTGGNPRAVAGGAFRALGDSAWGPLVTRSPAEGGELFLGLSWEGIPIGFVFGEHVPGDEDEFPGGGDDGDVAVFLAHDFAEEDAERPRVAVEVLGGLDEEPSCVGVAVLCDGSVVAVLGGLSGFGDEAEVGGGVVAVGESGDIAEGGEESACDGDVDAGDGHQQADLLPAVGDGGDLLVDPLELALGGLEEAQVGIDGFSSDGVEIEALEESAAVGTEEPGDGRLDQALVEDGVDAVFQACDVCDEDGAVGGESAHVTSGLVGDPDLREKAGAKELGEDQGVHFVGLDLGGGDGACAHGVGDDETRAVWGEDVGDAPGVGGGLESQGCVLAEVALGEAEECVASGGDPHTFEDPALGIEDADLGLLLVNVESDPSHGIISLVRAGPGRPGAWASAIPCGIPAGGWPRRPKRHQAGAGNESNGTYLFELAAQPGGPSGRPDTTAGSGPISVVGRPRSVRPPRTAFETAKHSVPIPVRGMRSDQGREENQEPGSLEHPPCSGAFLVSRMVDFPSWSSLSLVPGCLLEEVHTRYDKGSGHYGGEESGVYVDLWGWDGRKWEDKLGGHTLPARNDWGMVYDTARRRVVMVVGWYSGATGNGWPSMTWEWDGRSWMATRPAHHPPMMLVGPAMAYDQARGETVLFGGSPVGSPGILNQTWTWDGKDWTLRHPAHSPPSRWMAHACYDAARKRVVLFGGWHGAWVLRDTWEWDGKDWRMIKVTRWPKDGLMSGMCYDSKTGKIIGFLNYVGNPSDVMVEYDGKEWKPVTVFPSLPGFGQSFWGFPPSYDPIRDLFILPCTRKDPNPGQEKTCSVRIAPPKRVPICNPITVRTGTNPAA